MSNIFSKIYNDILLETIRLDKNIYREIYEDFVRMIKLVKEKDIQKISYKTFPAKTFKLDLSGTAWEHLKSLNPTVMVYYSMAYNESFMINVDPFDKNNRLNIKNGVGFIVFDLKQPVYTLVSIVEHELSHVLQELEKVYRRGVKDRDSKAVDRIGGLPSRRFVPKDITEHGYKIQRYFDGYIMGDNGQLVRKVINILATDEKQALKLAKAKISKMNFGDYKDKVDSVVVKTSSIMGTTAYSGGNRVNHTNRPIEYYPDVTTLLRLLQYNYHNNPDLNMKKSDYLNAFLTGQYDKLGKFYLLNMCTGIVEKLRNNTINKKVTRYQVYDKGNNKVMKVIAKDEASAIKKVKKALGNRYSNDMTVREAQNVSFYQYMIGKLTNRFLNEDYNEVYKEVRKSIDDINNSQKVKEQVKADKANKVSDKLPKGMPVWDFREGLQIIPIDMDIVGFDTEDYAMNHSHSESTEDFLNTLGLRGRENRYGQYSYNIPRKSEVIDKIFRRCRKYIDKYSGKDDYSEYVQYVTGARGLFKALNDSLKEDRYSIPDSVFEEWIGLPAKDPDFPNY